MPELTGTGTISMAITKQLALDPKWELYLINRGNRNLNLPENVKIIEADINDEALVTEKLGDIKFDCVCDFIGFVPSQLKRAVPDFVATTRFDEGARICLDYILSHKECQIDDTEFDSWCDRVIDALENAKKAILN